METHALKRVTIVAEAVLQERLLQDLKEAGARGYTLTRVEGRGNRGVRASDWEGRNVKIETLVSPEVADRILQHLAEAYFPHYAVVGYVDTVAVVRGDKYI